MRILLCTKNDLPALVAANRLADALRRHDVTIWLSDITRPAERACAELDIMRFFERELPLRWLLPALAGERQDGADCVDFSALARSLGTTVTVVPRLASVEAQFRALAPDLVISIRFSHIFPARFLDVPRHGILNIHPGYLPEYGGLYAPFHQMLAGRPRIGSTLHWIDAGIDTGPIVDIASIPVEPERSLFWHVVETYPAAIPALRRTIEMLEGGTAVPGAPQDPAEQHYYRMPDRNEMLAFKERFRLVRPDDFADVMAQFGVVPGASQNAAARAAVL